MIVGLVLWCLFAHGVLLSSRFIVFPFFFLSLRVESAIIEDFESHCWGRFITGEVILVLASQ